MENAERILAGLDIAKAVTSISLDLSACDKVREYMQVSVYMRIESVLNLVCSGLRWHANTASTSWRCAERRKLLHALDEKLMRTAV